MVILSVSVLRILPFFRSDGICHMKSDAQIFSVPKLFFVFYGSPRGCMQLNRFVNYNNGDNADK